MESLVKLIEEEGIEDVVDYILGDHYDDVVKNIEDSDIATLAIDRLSEREIKESFGDSFELSDLDLSDEDLLECVDDATIVAEAKKLNNEALSMNPARYISELLCDVFVLPYPTDKEIVLRKLHELFKVAPSKCEMSTYCSNFIEA